MREPGEKSWDELPNVRARRHAEGDHELLVTLQGQLHVPAAAERAHAEDFHDPLLAEDDELASIQGGKQALRFTGDRFHVCGSCLSGRSLGWPEAGSCDDMEAHAGEVLQVTGQFHPWRQKVRIVYPGPTPAEILTFANPSRVKKSGPGARTFKTAVSRPVRGALPGSGRQAG